MGNDTILTKICTVCGRELPATAKYFYRQRLGLRADCKSCFRERHVSTPEARKRLHDRRSSPEEKEKRKQYNARYNARPEVKAYQRKWHQEYHSDPEVKRRLQEGRKQYRATLQGKLVRRKGEHMRRARKYQSSQQYTIEDVQLQIKAQTDKKGHLHCWWCGKIISESENYHIDHRIPLIRGGSNGPENIVISHGLCNMRKHTQLPSDMGHLF